MPSPPTWGGSAAFHVKLPALAFELPPSCDVAIVGAGAAGLAAAIFARRFNRSRSVLLFDGARAPGAKILVSGGSRCNVTNAAVSERDFWGGKPSIIRRVLRAFPAADTIAFFREIGVSLHEEAGGKLFPDTNRARDVLTALLRECEAAGAQLAAGYRVTDLVRLKPDTTDTGTTDTGTTDTGTTDARTTDARTTDARTADDQTPARFRVVTDRGDVLASAVVLATGGQALPKSGSDGAGFGIARRLGHTIVPTTPALAPLLLDPADIVHAAVSGVSHDVELAVWVDDAVAIRLTGSLLWTHFGISGPVALNASRHWLRAQLEGRRVALTASFRPGARFDDVDADWQRRVAASPKASVQHTLASMLPASVAAAVLRHLGIDGTATLAHVPRDDRRRLSRALVEFPLPVSGSRGYTYAEATAGGIALTEIDAGTMASRTCPGLWCVGEVLDVDGRIGGFNFQWAWSSGFVAGRALASI
jgi:predicted Rossmann fold flavoprotein